MKKTSMTRTQAKHHIKKAGEEGWNLGRAMGAAIRKKKFDPEGRGYDYETAEKYGIKPDKTGHWQSREPKTGQILKGRNHPTFSKTVKKEKEAGYQVSKGGRGKYYSYKEGYKQSSKTDSIILKILKQLKKKKNTT